MSRSALIVISLAVLALGWLLWFSLGEPPASHESSLSPRADTGHSGEPPHESLAGDGPSDSDEARGTGRRVAQVVTSLGQAASEEGQTIVSGFFVDHRGEPLPGRSLSFRTTRGIRNVRTNDVGGFSRAVHGAWMPCIQSGSADAEELRVWSSSLPIETRSSEVLEVSEGTFLLKLVGQEPDYVQDLELRLPDGRPHANAGVKLRYRTDRGDWTGWHETQSSTDAEGRVSFRLWESHDIVDWILSTNGVAEPGERADVSGGRPVAITIGGRHLQTGPMGRFDPSDEDGPVRYTLGYARPLELQIGSLPFEDPKQLEFELLEVGKPLLTQRRFGAAGHSMVRAMLLPGPYEVRLSYGDLQWSQGISVEAAEPRVEQVRVRAPGGAGWRRRPKIVVDPQCIELDFRSLQRAGR